MMETPPLFEIQSDMVNETAYYSALLDGLEQDQWTLRKWLVPKRHLECATRFAFGHRCDQLRSKLHGRMDSLVLVSRHGHVQIFHKPKINRILLSFPKARLSYGLVGGIQAMGLIETKTVIEQRLSGCDSRIFAGSSKDHSDQTHILALGCGDQAITGGLGMAGLDTIDRGIAP